MNFFKNKMPKLFWYQINGKSAQENMKEQKKEMLERLTQPEEEEFEINLTSEVKKK